MKDDLKPGITVVDTSRRDFIKKSTAIAGAAGIMSMVPDAIRNAAWAAGSDAPEKTEVKIGFIPLTDCASVVIASVMGFDKKIRHQDYAHQGGLLGPPCATNW